MAAPLQGKHALSFGVLASCSVSKARTGVIRLPHADVESPVFMPVGTQGTLKGMTPEQVEATGCRMILGNTYHLGHRPGPEIIAKAGGLHKFMNWKHGLLTDSGGFQMVSLVELSEITEEGVKFESPHDKSQMLLTPEKSIEIQNSIGADIMMQLDDVVSSTTTGPRVEEAMWRSLRWLDRSIAANKRPHEQSLFPIVQGGLDTRLRTISAQEVQKRETNGYAIGGLSGGEEKSHFWRMVTLSTDILPKDKPRYLMGVGFAIDLVVCVALGCDMFDCVFPTRTARFGSALVDSGQLNLKQQKFAKDFRPIDADCPCFTCQGYTRAYLHTIVTHEDNACTLVSIHNVAYQMGLMRRIRDAIKEDRYPDFVRSFIRTYYSSKPVPEWVKDALSSVNVSID